MLKGGTILGMKSYQQQYYKPSWKSLSAFVEADWWVGDKEGWGSELGEGLDSGEGISVETVYAWNPNMDNFVIHFMVTKKNYF